MSGRKSRTKGHSFERWVAIQLRPIYPRAIRHLEYQHGEANGSDLAYTGKYRIQCKRGKKYASVSAIKEVKLDGGGVPVLVTRGDHEEALAVVPFQHFISLLKELKVARLKNRG